MSLQIDNVVRICREVGSEIHEHYKNLTLHFIVHHDGQMTEALSLATHDIAKHPAMETALKIMTRHRRSEKSSFLGAAVAREHYFLGLASRSSQLALSTMNVEEFDNIDDACRHAYHLAWHAIDAYRYSQKSPSTQNVVVRKRNALELSAANLQADIFSALVSYYHNDKNSLDALSRIRGLDVLSPVSLKKPEIFPFIIASEATRYVLEQIQQKNVSDRQIVPMALKASYEVGKVFDADAIRKWITFSRPAQDMAWRGFRKEEILSAAINTCQDTEIRSTGYLVAEITGITPTSILDMRDKYSAFADENHNAELHEKAIEKVYEYAIAQGLREKSIEPFLVMANKQNHKLTEGHAIGWCAAALQALASSFENLLSDDDDRAVATKMRKVFDDERTRTSWPSLRELSDKVVRAHRQGQLVTLNQLEELSREVKGVQALQQSIRRTILDPAYQQKLENVNDFTPSAAPAAPQLKAAPAAPAVPAAAALPAPALGGRSAAAAAQAPAEKAETEKQSEKQAGKQAETAGSE